MPRNQVGYIVHPRKIGKWSAKNSRFLQFHCQFYDKKRRDVLMNLAVHESFVLLAGPKEQNTLGFENIQTSHTYRHTDIHMHPLLTAKPSPAKLRLWLSSAITNHKKELTD